MYFSEFLTIAVAHFFAVASPGPDFAVVLRQSVRYGRGTAIWTSLGVGCAILLHVTYCLLGVALFLSASPTAFSVVKLSEAAYLAYLGWQSLAPLAADWARDKHGESASRDLQRGTTANSSSVRGKENQRVRHLPMEEATRTDNTPDQLSEMSPSARSAFVIGFLTNGLNPKATLFFLALFTVVISPSTPTEIQILYGCYLAVATFVWFTLLSFLLDRPVIKLRIVKAGDWLDRVMGIILIALALQVVLTL